MEVDGVGDCQLCPDGLKVAPYLLVCWQLVNFRSDRSQWTILTHFVVTAALFASVTTTGFTLASLGAIKVNFSLLNTTQIRFRSWSFSLQEDEKNFDDELLLYQTTHRGSGMSGFSLARGCVT